MRAFRLVWTALLLAAVCLPTSARAQEEPADSKAADPGMILTFYGLRKLEQDPAATDEQKMREWSAFIERAGQQIEYAKKAVDRWKNAAKVRVIDDATATDQNADAEPRDKIAKWEEVEKLYPKTKDARRAQKRIAHWNQEETKRLASAAEEVERARRPKVERIQAWSKVLEWAKKGPEARAADKRTLELQQQLYTEALSADKIARVDDRTKLEAWRDVLNGRPDSKQRADAQRRIGELEAKIIEQENEMKTKARSDATGGGVAPGGGR